MGMYFVGIDGGGTSCRARIKDAQGNFIGEANIGTIDGIGYFLCLCSNMLHFL